MPTPPTPQYVSFDLDLPVTSPAQSHTTVLYEGVHDVKARRVAYAQIRFAPTGGGRNTELWKGDAYDAAGQYTDDDVVARLKVVLSGAVI